MGIVILGAGQAGLQLALSLRQKGYRDALTLVGDEPHLPYQRPPLSKAFLKGASGAAALALRSAEALAAENIELRLGSPAQRVDRKAKCVYLDDALLPYDRLALALGTRPRRLAIPGAELPGVLTLRGIADGEALLAALATAENVVIVGGGFIGLEVAATATAAGKTVTVLEAGPRVMARAVAPEVSAWFETMHRDMGTTILTSSSLVAIAGTERVETVTLADGVSIRADIVLVGIGAIPNIEIAAEAGLDCPNGVAVDEFGRSSDPAIYAVGDCSLHPNRFAGGMFRLESVQNAIDQAKAVAGAMLGEPTPYHAVPWFWSDQGSAKLQTTGLPIGTELCVVRGDPSAGRFSVFHLRGGRIIAVDSVSSPADHMHSRRLIEAGVEVAPEWLGDPTNELKTLLTRAAA